MTPTEQDERARIDALKRKLVGAVLAASDHELAIEATFATHFDARFAQQQQFWPAFAQACCNVADGKPWATERQLLLSCSLPQEVNAKDARGETMLTLAAANARAKVVSILCQIKADPKIENAKGWSTMHVAAAYNHVPVLEALLALDVDVNVPDSRLGYTPLHLAASVDHVDVLKYLHASGKADFALRARNGFTVLHVAAAHGSEACVTFLAQAFPQLTHATDTILHESPAHKAAKYLQPRVYQHLLHYGARDDVKNDQDETASDLASFNTRYNY